VWSPPSYDTSTRQRIAATQPAGIHLGAEEGDGAGDQRVDVGAQPVDLRRRHPAQLAHQAEEGRTAHGQAEHGPHDGVDPIQRIVSSVANGGVDDHSDLAGRRLQHGVDELLLAGEPVQDRLLAHTDLGGDVVERHGVDATGAEALTGDGQDAVTGAGRNRHHRRHDGGLPLSRPVEHWLPSAVERVYAILDNLSTHRATDVLLFVLAHPRWEFVFQPKYAAYLNLIEPWWKTLRSLALKGRRFETWTEVCDAIHAATAYWNAHRHPFVWGRRRRHHSRRRPGIALFATPV